MGGEDAGEVSGGLGRATGGGGGEARKKEKQGACVPLPFLARAHRGRESAEGTTTLLLGSAMSRVGYLPPLSISQ